MSDLISPITTTSDPVIVIGDKEYTVKRFVTAKFLRATSLVTRLLDAADISSLIDNRDNFAPLLLKKIPTLLETSEEYLLQFCALVLTSNAELRTMNDKDESLDNYLAKFAKELKWDADVDVIMETLTVGIEQMGVQSLVKNVGRLQNLFRPH